MFSYDLQDSVAALASMLRRLHKSWCFVNRESSTTSSLCPILAAAPWRLHYSGSFRSTDVFQIKSASQFIKSSPRSFAAAAGEGALIYFRTMAQAVLLHSWRAPRRTQSNATTLNKTD